MDKNGLKNVLFGKKIGVSHVTIGRWLRNERSPSVSDLISLSEVFNVSIDWLLKGDRYDNPRISEPEIIYAKTPICDDGYYKLLYIYVLALLSQPELINVAEKSVHVKSFSLEDIIAEIKTRLIESVSSKLERLRDIASEIERY